MILKPKYSPWEKVELVSGVTWYINYIMAFDWYYTYNVWDWFDKFISMDEWQIKCSLTENGPIGFEIHLDNPGWQ